VDECFSDDRNARFGFTSKMTWPARQGERVLLRQHLLQPLSNAVKYSPEGSGVEFNVRR